MAELDSVYLRRLGLGFTMGFGLLENYPGVVESGRCRSINNTSGALGHRRSR